MEGKWNTRQVAESVAEWREIGDEVSLPVFRELIWVCNLLLRRFQRGSHLIQGFTHDLLSSNLYRRWCFVFHKAHLVATLVVDLVDSLPPGHVANSSDQPSWIKCREEAKTGGLGQPGALRHFAQAFAVASLLPCLA